MNSPVLMPVEWLGLRVRPAFPEHRNQARGRIPGASRADEKCSGLACPSLSGSDRPAVG